MMHPVPNTRTEYNAREHEHFHAYSNPTKSYSLTYSTYREFAPWVKVTLSLLLALWITIGMFSSVIPAFIGIPVAAVWTMVLINKIYYGKSYSKTLRAADIPNSLRDEAGECLKVAYRLQEARRLSPEGLGIENRTEEFHRILWQMMLQMEELLEVNELVGGWGKAYYGQITKIKNDLTNLEQSGKKLVELTANKRVESVMTGMEMTGVEQFKSAVDIEMMAYRALGMGDE